MRKRDLERFEKILLARREELMRDMGLFKDMNLSTTTKEATGDHSSHSFHMADQGTDAMEREKAFLLASKTGRLVYHINDALRRIGNGSFGKCLGCGKQISTARLLAVPHARFCISCKEREEEAKATTTTRRKK
ncbi:MAG: TraR/DksA C4-type zinc finger protein [bacterium]|nr:TraR/DksA C4-type zinc finger protein [bacterium]